MKLNLDFNKLIYDWGKKETSSFCSVNTMQAITIFFFVRSPPPPSSLGSTSCKHQRVLSGQAIFKKINVSCVCVFYSCINEEKKKQPKNRPSNCLVKVLNAIPIAVIHQPHHVFQQLSCS